MKKDEYLKAIDSIKLSEDKTDSLIKKIPEKRKYLHRKQLCLKIISTALSILLICGAIIIPAALSKSKGSVPAISGDNTSISAVESNPSPADTVSGTDKSDGIPDWYEPGRLVVKTISQNYIKQLSASSDTNVKMLAAPADKKTSESTNINLPSGFQFNGSTNATILKITDTSGEHSGCKDVFYDTESGKTICLDHLFKDAMQAAGTDYGNFTLKYYKDDLTKAIFTTYIKGAHPKYVMFDIKMNTLKVIPIKYESVQDFLVSQDYHYAYYLDYKTDSYIDAQDVYRQDLTDLNSKRVRISEVNGTSYNIRAKYLETTAFGRIIYFPIIDDDGKTSNGTDARWMIYNTENQKTILISGSIIRFAGEDSIVIVNSPDGIKLIDTKTGEEISDTGVLKPYEKYSIKVDTKILKGYTYSYNITLNPIFDKNAENITVASKANCYIADKDYVYSYIKDTDYVSIFSLENYESFNVKINSDFIEAVNKVKENNNLFYYFSINQNKTCILLYYNISQISSNQDVPVINKITETFPEVDCLEDLYDIIHDYSSEPIGKKDTRSCIMYKGEGFNSLVLFYTGRTVALVEDYRDKTFTFYSIGINSQNVEYFSHGEFDVYLYDSGKPDYEKYRKKLDSSATSENTLKLFDFVSTEQAYVDYSKCYTGNTLDYDKIFRYVHSPDEIMGLYKYGYIFNMKVQKNLGYDIIDHNLFKELLQIAYNQDLKSYNATQASKLFKDFKGNVYYSETADFVITCSTYEAKKDSDYPYFEFKIGSSTEGKKYIKYGDRFAYVSEADFTKLSDICNQLYKK